MNQSATWVSPLRYSGNTRQSWVQHGLILIPDISGYSEFVKQTDIVLGKQIVYKLLTAIVQTNRLGLQVSEIEGDAVLFYRYGQPPSVSKILVQFERMLAEFNDVLSRIHPTPVGLSLKMIAHYGPIAEFQIDQFRKLYGETLVVAHGLLKNSVDSRCYVLMTDDLMTAVTGPPLSGSSRAASQLCEVSGSLRKVCYSYYNYEDKAVA